MRWVDEGERIFDLRRWPFRGRSEPFSSRAKKGDQQVNGTPEQRELLGVLHFLAERRGDARGGVVSEAFSVVREENSGGGVEGLRDGAEGVLGGLFSGRIGLARLGAFYSATGG